mgnify:CR=1 FL=1
MPVSTSCLPCCHGAVQNTLVEWFASNYDKFGATLELVTNRSQEGTQFCKGFGGVGGLLRWKVDFAEMDAGADLGAGDADWSGGEDEGMEDIF